MKGLRRPALIAMGLILAAAVGTAFIARRHLLISYHGAGMANVWQSAHGTRSQNAWVVSVRKFFGLPSVPDSRRAIAHRDALVKLGYLTARNYAIEPVNLGTPEFTRLCERVATQTGQEPTAQFEFNPRGSQAVSLTVWATPQEFPRWDKFAAELALARTRGKQSRLFFADALGRLLAMPLETQDDLAAWHAASKQLRQAIRLQHPDLEYEGPTYQFLSRVDAETRRRDPAYRRWQEDAVRSYIAKVRAEK
jgi:hypothetical protein